MKKISLYISIALTGLFMGSCGDDFTDWANPQTNPQEDAITIPGYEAHAVSAIDLANVADDSVPVYTISTATLPEGFTLENARVELTPEDVDGAKATEVATTLDGKAATADLQSLIVSAYGKRPTARTFAGQVYVSAVKDGEAALIDAGKVKVVVTPKAPFIDAGYYLVGDMLNVGEVSGWSADGMKAFSHSGSDVYDDPIFTVTFSTSADNQYWKIIPKKNADAGNIWADGVVGTKVDGDDSMTGELTNEGAQAGKIAKAGKYKMTINMMDYTYSIEEMNYDSFIYFIGATDGWTNADQKLALTDDANGVYTGYIYCADPKNCGNEFKFQRVPGSWDNEINAGTFSAFEGAAANKGGNIGVSDGEGVYYFEVNLGSGSIKATKVNSMGIIGDFNSWAGDVEMKWNADEYCFEATNVDVTAAGWKFRVNNGWDINLGGTLQNLVLNGDNLVVGGNIIKLYPTRKTSENIYCTVK